MKLLLSFLSSKKRKSPILIHILLRCKFCATVQAPNWARMSGVYVTVPGWYKWGTEKRSENWKPPQMTDFFFFCLEEGGKELCFSRFCNWFTVHMCMWKLYAYTILWLPSETLNVHLLPMSQTQFLNSACPSPLLHYLTCIIPYPPPAVIPKYFGTLFYSTRYGLDGPGFKSWWGRDFPHPSWPALGLTQSPVKLVPGLFPWSKAAWLSRRPPTPI